MLEKRRLERFGIGIGVDRLDEQPALKRHPDRIGRGVALAPPAPSLRGIERLEQGGTDHRRSQLSHGQRPSRPPSRADSATTPTAASWPCGGGRRPPPPRAAIPSPSVA